MKRLVCTSALSAMLAVGASLIAWAASAEAPGPAGADSAAFCTSYSTGTDTHTACAPQASAPPGSAIACHNYIIGSDTHAECAPVAAPRLSVSGDVKRGPTPRGSALRCYTYRIGASSYTDCR